MGGVVSKKPDKAPTPAPVAPVEPKQPDAATQAASQGGAGRAANTFGGGGNEGDVLGAADEFSVRKKLLGN